MDKTRLEACKQKIYSQMPVLGGWIRRKAAEELAQAVHSDNVEVINVILDAVTKSTDQEVRTRLLSALGNIKDQKSIDSACALWASTRHSELDQLLKKNGWVASTPNSIRVLSALKNGKADLVTKGSGDLFEHLMQAAQDKDSDIAKHAHDGLGKLQSSELIDALCTRWAKDRDDKLSDLIKQKGYIARQPLEVQVLCALKIGKLDVITKAGTNILDALLAACNDRDKDIAKQAQLALGQLKTPETQQALCKLVLERDLPAARQAVITAGYAPQDSKERLVFLLLTEQFEKYESLDYDQKQLQGIYAKADAKVKSRIEEKANKRGYILVEPVYTERKHLKLVDMTDQDWQELLPELEANKQRAEVLRLIQEAPARWSWQILKDMKRLNWVPRGDEKKIYEELVKLADECELIGGKPQGDSYITLEKHKDVVNCLALSSDGKFLASGSQDQTINIWSLPEGKHLAQLSGHTGAINCLSFTNDNKMLISGGDNSIRLWQMPDGKLQNTLAGHTDEVNCLAISPDGKTLASGSLDNSVRLWSLPDGKELKELKEHSGSIWALLFSPGGNILASGGGLSDHNVRLWGVPGGNMMKTLEGHKGLIRSLVFSNDGKKLVSGSGDNNIRLWDLAEGKELKLLKGHKGLVTSLLLSSDGKTLISGSVDKSVRFWDLNEGKEIKKFERHKDRITALLTDAAWRVIITSSWDNTIKFTTSYSKTEFKTLQGHSNWVTCMALTPNGDTLASGSREGAVRLWHVKPSLIAHLPARQTTFDDLSWVEKGTQNSTYSAAEQKEMAFLAALMRWRQQVAKTQTPMKQMDIGKYIVAIAD